MKKIYSLITLLIISCSIYAQSPSLDWVMKLGDNYKNDNSSFLSDMKHSGTSICVSHDGYIYSVGRFSKTVDFDNSSSNYELSTCHNSASAYVVKYDLQGNLIWAKQLCTSNAGSGNILDIHIKLDKNEEPIILTQFKDFMLDSTITDSNSIYLYNGINFIKLNKNGKLIWNKHFMVPSDIWGEHTLVESYKFDSKNNLIAAGIFKGSIDFNPGIDSFVVSSSGNLNSFLVKLNSNGDFSWVNTIEGNNGFNNLSIDNDDNMYLSGNYSDSIDLDFGPNKNMLFSEIHAIPNSLFNGFFIIKVDSNLNILWNKNLKKDNAFFNNTIDNENNFIFFTKNNDTINIFSSVTDSVQYYFENIFKISPDGIIKWAKNIGPLYLNNFISDKNSNLYFSGYFSDSTYLNPNDTTIKSFSKGNNDIFLLKLDSLGNYVFDFTTGEKKADKCYGLFVDDNFNIFMTGTFNDSIDFDPSTIIQNLNCADTIRSIFISKFNQYPLSVNNISKTNIANLYPNPTSGILNLEMNENANLIVSNSLGEIILKQKVSKGLSTINMSNKPVGIYFVRLQTDQYSETIKIVNE